VGVVEKLLSLITFFAAAKKVIPPPGRRLLNKRQETSNKHKAQAQLKKNPYGRQKKQTLQSSIIAIFLRTKPKIDKWKRNV
jgi:hypothetical protein